MVIVLGLDVGGANTKASFLRIEKEHIVEHRTSSRYLPLWERKEELVNIVKELGEDVAGNAKVDALGVTMTGELSDAYSTKREGVNHILDQVENVFGRCRIYVLDVDGILRTISEARRRPLNTAGANWVATGWMVSQWIEDCLVVDVGSTTTDLIPIADGEIFAEGRSDLERLSNGELIYTGGLRTNVATIVDRIPIRGEEVRVSSELFATSGDVHLILGNLTMDDYMTETADGRGKLRREAMSRLARIVCADMEMLSEWEVVEMARYIHERQVDMITEGIRQVLEGGVLIGEEVIAVVAGLGGEFLGAEAARETKIKNIVNLSEIIGREASASAPSTGVALMAANELGVGMKEWHRS